MKKYQFWNKKDALYTPSGKAYTAEEYLAAHAWARLPGVKCVINTGAINCAVFLEFENMKAACIKQGMIIPEQASDEEILTLIEEWENRSVYSEPTAQDRIAAALEYQNVLATPDEKGE